MVVLKRATERGSPFFMTNFPLFKEYSRRGALICRVISLAQKIIDFYKTLQPPSMPRGVEILYPQKNKEVIQLVKTFFNKFYDDNKSRHLIFGINPGRFGAGTTGINFTAPKQLKHFCGIDHPFRSQTELSAEFIYEFIEAYGGVKKFYNDYFITSVSPLGFMKDGVNLNYYDDKKLQHRVTPFITESIQKQLSLGFQTDYCICIGGDKNHKFFSSLNDEHQFFEKIIPLPHPRFIMQYRRKQKQKYIDQYLSTLRVS
jgi:uracil DNA glycosylase superfamily protein